MLTGDLPVRLPSGGILVPKRAAISDLPGATIGDGAVELIPGSAEWVEWDTWIRLYGSESDNPSIDDRPAEAR
jgi:hypothetical protein